MNLQNKKAVDIEIVFKSNCYSVIVLRSRIFMH